jgi:hypothetical protein
MEKFIESFTPAQRAAYERQKAITDKQVAPFLERKKVLSVDYGSVAPAQLSPIGKQFQQMVLARDWDALFKFLPLPFWKRYGNLGKFSFVDQGGQRTYIPFSEADIRRFVFSPYYTVQPGYVCTDGQREMGVNALMKAGVRHQEKFPASDWRHIWPIYPGGGYGDQNFGCEKYTPSTWVKIRKPVVAAAAVVAAVYLGPMVYDKISGALAGASEGGAIAGAGSKAGAVAKAGTAATATTGTAATAASKAALFAKVQTGVELYNKANTVNAIIKGEMPPPPISITGSNFTEWAFDEAKGKLVEEYQRQLTKKEEAQLRAEIEQMQRELAQYIPPGTPVAPSPELDPAIQQRIAQMQALEKQDNQNLLLMGAAGIGALLLLG